MNFLGLCHIYLASISVQCKQNKPVFPLVQTKLFSANNRLVPIKKNYIYTV